ncbi:MAG: glycosyltransferase family 2 protein [Planctomycetes bacterium]|nr:glycosyltransferase family 2 protein [Planctomycetota bacterium]
MTNRAAPEPPLHDSPLHDPPLVAAVVVNWNGLADTRSSVRSLLAQLHPRTEIHVVDNGSANGEADALDAEFGERIRLWRSATNLGFAAGNNLALRAILADGLARYVALLNNDAIAEPDWLRRLVAAAEAEPTLGACASHMVFRSDPRITENTGTVVLRTGEAIPRDRGRPAAASTAPATVLGVCGGAALYRVEALRDAGLFRDEFFLNFEDVDLSLRLAALGWQQRFVPGAVVRHGLSQSIGRVRDDAFRVRSIRNLTFAYLANMPWQVVLLGLPWLFVSHVVAPLAALLVGQWSFARVLVRGRCRAFRDLGAILAVRRSLRPRRRGSWTHIWWRQGSFVGMYARFLRDVVVLRRRRAME